MWIFNFVEKRIDWKSIHNRYSHIFMKCNMHKCIQRQIKIYAEGTRWRTGMISLVQIHRQNMEKTSFAVLGAAELGCGVVVFLFWGWGSGGKFFPFSLLFWTQIKPHLPHGSGWTPTYDLMTGCHALQQKHLSDSWLNPLGTPHVSLFQLHWHLCHKLQLNPLWPVPRGLDYPLLLTR